MAREIKMTDTQFKAVEEGRMKSNDLETVEITKEYLEYLEGTEKSLEQQRKRNNELAYDKRLKEIELAGAMKVTEVLGELKAEHEDMIQAATLQHIDLVRAKIDFITELTNRKKEEVDNARLCKAISDVNEKLRQANIDAKRAEDNLKKFGTESADLFIEKSKENEELRKKVDDLWNEILEREEVANGLKAENKDLVKENSELRAETSGITARETEESLTVTVNAEPQTLIPNDIEETLKIIKDRFTSFGAYDPTEVADKLRKYITDRETTLHEMMDKLAAVGNKRRKERDLINCIASHLYIDSLGHELTNLVHFGDLKRSLNEPIK